MNQKTFAAGESAFFIVVIAGILVAMNVVGCFVWGRADLTKRDLFTLSEGSKATVRQLQEPLEVTGYFTEDLPAPHNSFQRYVRDVLREYEAVSRGKIRIRFVNPDTDEKREKANQAGMKAAIHRTLQNDSVVVKEGYRGIVFKYLGETETVPVLESTDGLEYQFTQIIRKLIGKKIKVGVISGVGGPTLTEGLTKLKAGLPTYEFSEISGEEEIPADIRTVIIVNPEQAISENRLRRINQFLMRGGTGLGIFGGTEKIDLKQGIGMLTAAKVETGVNDLLHGWGLRVESNIVADTHAERIPMQHPSGFQIPVVYPPLPSIAFTEAQQEHPVLFRIRGVQLPFVSSITDSNTLRSGNGVKKTVLARSSDENQSWLLTGDSIALAPRPFRSCPAGQPGSDCWDFSGRKGPHTLAVALEGTLPSAYADKGTTNIEAPARAAGKSRVLVVGTASFLRDEFMPQGQPGQPPDLNAALAFALNSLDWLSQDTNLIAIRAKNTEDPTLPIPQNLESAQEDALKADEEGAAAQQEGQIAALQGDRNKLQDAQSKLDDASARKQEASDRFKTANASWERRKTMYKWFNTLGVPLLVVLFGIARWMMRDSATKKSS